MASQTTTVLLDDIDGTKAENTTTFVVDGVSYEIDLSSKNAKAFRESLAPWVTNARKTAGRGKQRRSQSKNNLNAQVRAWARENDIPVSSRGRVSQAIVAQYQAS